MVVQSRLAEIGTDTSPTLILNVCEIVPPASTLPVNVSVTVDASVAPAVRSDVAATARATVTLMRTLLVMRTLPWEPRITLQREARGVHGSRGGRDAQPG